MDPREVKYMDYIKNRYPQLEILKTECDFAEGRYCDTVTVNDNDVFKFSKYDWSIGFLENEVKVLKLIGRGVDMPLPQAEALEKGIARFSYIKGGPVYRNVLLLAESRVQEGVAWQLGVFLKQLHSMPSRGERHGDLPCCPAVMSQREWLVKYEELERKVFPYCDSYSKEYYRQIFKPVEENEKFMDFQPVLVHGALTPEHIKFYKNKINGVTDFELSGTGDPAYDVGMILDNLGEAFVRRIGRYYRDIRYFIDRARFYAYTSNLLWAGGVSDMLAARDFTNFRITARERDIMPLGTRWSEH